MAEPTMSIITEKGGHRIVVFVDGRRLETPALEHLLYYAGLGALVAVELMELPVAIALTVGHALLDLTKRPGLQTLGRALEEA